MAEPVPSAGLAPACGAPAPWDPPAEQGSDAECLWGALAAALYAPALDALRAALSGGRRTALLTGGDGESRRALAAVALPGAATGSCLLAGADEGRSLLALGASTGGALVLHDADAGGAEAAVAALLDGAPGRAVLATAAVAAAVAPALRRAHRLDAHVRLAPPPPAASAAAWALVLPRLLPALARDGLPAVAAAAASAAAAAPAFALGDVLRACGAHLAAPRARGADALLARLAGARPRGGALPFACAGPRARARAWAGVGGYPAQKAVVARALRAGGGAGGAALARLGARAPRGVLVHGRRGTGKTVLARAALALAPDVNSLCVAGPDLFSRFLGESERRVRALFAEARALAPCVVFIDDVDAVAADRAADDAGSGTGVERRVLGALLAELDGIGGDEAQAAVTLLACTSRIEDMDAALLRPGRIDVLVELPLPGLEDRMGILREAARDMPLETLAGPAGKEDVLREVALLTAGRSAADLSGLCRRAALLAMEEEEEPNTVLERQMLAAAAELSGT